MILKILSYTVVKDKSVDVENSATDTYIIVLNVEKSKDKKENLLR